MKPAYLIGGLVAAAAVALARRPMPADPAITPSDGNSDPTATPRPGLEWLVKGVAVAEGYYRPDGSLNSGALPVRLNNPGDLTDYHTGQLIQFGSEAEGMAAARAYWQRVIDGTATNGLTPDMTLPQIARIYTGDSGQAAANWARAVAQYGGFSLTAPIGAQV